MDPKKGMSTVERRTLILEKLDEEGQLDVTTLSKEMAVSEVTIATIFLTGWNGKINSSGLEVEL